MCPHRLVRPRTPAFQAGDEGSNPSGDAKKAEVAYAASAFLFV